MEQKNRARRILVTLGATFSVTAAAFVALTYYAFDLKFKEVYLKPRTKVSKIPTERITNYSEEFGDGILGPVTTFRFADFILVYKYFRELNETEKEAKRKSILKWSMQARTNG